MRGAAFHVMRCNAADLVSRSIQLRIRRMLVVDSSTTEPQYSSLFGSRLQSTRVCDYPLSSVLTTEGCTQWF